MIADIDFPEALQLQGTPRAVTSEYLKASQIAPADFSRNFFCNPCNPRNPEAFFQRRRRPGKRKKPHRAVEALPA